MSVISIRKYAAVRGCSEGNVRAAIRTGKISRALVKDEVGKVKGIDQEIADKEWSENYNTDRIRNNSIFNTLKGKPDKANIKPVVKSIPVAPPGTEVSGFAAAKAIIGHLADLPPSDDQQQQDEDETEEIPDSISMAEAKRREAVFKAKLLQRQLMEKNAELVNADQVRKSLFEFGSEVRTAIMEVPSQIVDNLMASRDRNEANIILTTALSEALLKLADANTRKLA